MAQLHYPGEPAPSAPGPAELEKHDDDFDLKNCRNSCRKCLAIRWVVTYFFFYLPSIFSVLLSPFPYHLSGYQVATAIFCPAYSSFSPSHQSEMAMNMALDLTDRVKLVIGPS